MKAYLLILSAAFTLARADEPQPTAVQPTAEQPAAEHPATEVEPAPAPKPAPKAGESAAITDAQFKQTRGRGYKPVMRKGTMLELSGKEYVNSILQQGSPTPFKGP